MGRNISDTKWLLPRKTRENEDFNKNLWQAEVDSDNYCWDESANQPRCWKTLIEPRIIEIGPRVPLEIAKNTSKKHDFSRFSKGCHLKTMRDRTNLRTHYWEPLLCSIQWWYPHRSISNNNVSVAQNPRCTFLSHFWRQKAISSYSFGDRGLKFRGEVVQYISNNRSSQNFQFRSMSRDIGVTKWLLPLNGRKNK